MKIWPMFCKACGQGIDRGDKFCRNCGVPLPQEPIETAVAASATASATGEPPIPIASTAALQRPLPIPKALLTEVASAAGVEEKVPPPAIAPPSVAAGEAASDRARSDSPVPAPEKKPEAAAAGQVQKPAEPKLEGASQKTAEAKPAIAETPAQPAAEKPVSSPTVQPAPAQPAESSAEQVKPEPEKQTKPSDTAKRAAVIAAAIASATAPKAQVEQAAVSERPPQAATPTPETAKPEDIASDAAARSVRLCPQCHRLVGEDDAVCPRCRARLEQPASRQPATQQPAAVSEQHYGVPSFAGYAAEPDSRKSTEIAEVHVSDPSGIDAIANLRVRRRRGLSAIEIVVAVILLAGAGVAVWMLRSSLPNKAATSAVSVDISISPARVKVAAGHGYDLAATVTGTDNYNVDWSIDEGDSGGRIVPRGAKAKDGGVSSLAVYMAPKTPGTYHVTATSKADAGKSASATMTVTGK